MDALGLRPLQLPADEIEPMTSVSEPIVEARAIEPDRLNSGAHNGNPKGIGFLALLKEDLQVNGGSIFDQGFMAIAVQRFGNWRMSFRLKMFRAPLTLLFRFLSYAVEILTGISLPYTVSLGRRVRIWHHSGIVLNARAIGDDVHIRQNTTFGVISIERAKEIPTIGNRVDIGCGACILGGVTVGDDCTIGANAVVTSDVPPNSMAVGIPARIIRKPLRG
jgi:serine O-acetyltransferase